MQIIVRQISGLGNQLFQYAAGRYFGTHYNVPVRMAIDPPGKAFSYGHPRPFLLDAFCITTPYREFTEWERLMLSQKKALKPVLAVLQGVTRTQVFIEPIAQYYSYTRDVPLKPGVNTLILAGYWQSFQMVEAVADILRAEFRYKHQAEGKNLEVLQQIRQTDDAVSLHVRRGDYALAAESHRTLPLTYYNAAIQHFRERLKQPKFFVFSDDIPFAKANLPEEFVFVDHNDEASPHEDLRLMSACGHHIIANSSLSWWGAWLNPSPTKMVYAPKHWMLTPDSYFPGLLPPEWTLLDSVRSA